MFPKKSTKEESAPRPSRSKLVGANWVIWYLLLLAVSLRRNDDFYFLHFRTLLIFIDTLARETSTFGVHFLALGVSGGPPAAWAPEGSTYSFYQHSRAKRLFSLLVASWALLGPGCPRAFSGRSSSILCAGAVFRGPHVVVCYTCLLICLFWRPPYIVKTNTNLIFVVFCLWYHFATLCYF